MLNSQNERELAYVAKIEEVRSLEGYDKVEYARIGAGWWVIVRKGQFNVGDLGVYFEVDSRVPAEEPFMFLEKKKFKIKTLKMCKVVSQGLLMSFEDFGWEKDKYAEGTFLTKQLKVTYADDSDNVRKAPTKNKYASMQDRHKTLFDSGFGKFMMKYKLGREVMFLFFGKKKDKRNWPEWVKKTDEERCQNMPWLFNGNSTNWIVTEKIDGTSTTFTMKNTRKKKLIVCSRNVVFDTPEKESHNWYKDTDGNVYLEMAQKYHMQQVCENAIAYWQKTSTPLDYITIQGETYGGTIQKRHYGDEHRLAIFNVIFGFKNGNVVRLNPIEMVVFLKNIQVEGAPLEPVPVLTTKFKLPDTCEELLNYANGISVIDGNMREGLVFRSVDGKQSFKAVSNEFLLKYHA